MKRFNKILRFVGLTGKYQCNLKDEKAFVNSQFVGTKWGITAPSLAGYLGRTPTAEEMQNLSKTDAIKLLYQKHWTNRGLINLENDSVAALIYNGLSNIGTNEMRLLIKQVVIDLGYFIDYYDVFTPKGIALLNQLDQSALFNKLFAIKKKSMRRIKNKAKKNLFLKQLYGIRFYQKGQRNSKASIKNRLPKSLVKQLYNGLNLSTARQ